MAPRKPKTIPPIDLDDIVEQVYGTTTTIPSAPTTTIPNIPKPSTAPSTAVLSPGVKAAEQRLRSTARSAEALGIDPSKYYQGTITPAVVSGTSITGNPAIDAILAEASGAAGTTKTTQKEDDGFWESLGKGALGALGDVVNTVDVGRRFVISSAKELGDIATGGDASFGEWWDQLNDPNLSSRILIPDVGPEWLQATLGFAGDILLDPTTYLTLGGSAVAKTSVKVGTNLALKEVAEAGAEKLVKAGIDKAAIEAAQKTAKDLVDNAAQYADDLTKWGAGNADELVILKQNAQRATQQANDMVLDAAKKLDGRGGRILKAEDARQAAYQKWANTVSGSAAQKAARKELDSATSYLARQSLVRGGARRQYRATAREILGENATAVRNMADNIIKVADAKIATGVALDATEEAIVNAARKTVQDLSDNVIADIYKRGYGALRGAGEGAGLALGTRTGTRIGVGRASAYLGKGRLTGIGGSALTKLRAGAFAKAPGVLDWITPLGRKGIFGDADLLKMRRALQTGMEGGAKLAGDKAKVYGAAIALQRAEEVVRKRVEGALISSAKNVLIDISDEEAPIIRQYLEDGVAIGDQVLQDKANKVRGWLDSTYKEYADRVASLGDDVKVGIPNYFPNVQSTEALEWMAKNPRLADELAKNLGVNRQYVADNFIERTLVPGRVWFGHVLTADDIRGGITRLNQIARESGGLKFDFFETNLKRALGRYAQKHAANVAFLDTVEKFAGENVDEILTRLQNLDPSAGFLDDITKVVPEAKATDSLLQRAVKDVGQADLQAVTDALDDLYGVLQMNFRPNRLRLQWTKADVFDVEQRLIELRNTVDDIATQGDVGLAQQFLRDVDDLTKRVLQISQGTDVVPAAARLTMDEIDATIQRVLTDIADPDVLDTAVDLGLTVRQIDPVTGQPLVGASIENILSLFGKTQDDRWKQLSRGFSEGFEALGMRDIQDIGARTEVIQIFNRLQQVTDKKFAAGLERVIGDFNTFFKSWSTATVGFHFRNAMSNAFQLVAAGVGIRSMSEGSFWYNKYLKDTTERASKKAGAFLTPDEWVKTLNVSDVKKKQIADALYLTGADGQMSEVFDEARRIGVSGKEVGDTAILRRTRGALGSPLKTSRAIGQYVEGNTRFIMNFDALGKGLDETEALARTNKYLFDYQNLSSLDRVVKNIVPFWIWTSRNFPLYLENIVTNPRAYARYGQFRRAAEGQEAPYLPQGLKESGAFTLRPEIARIPGIAGFTDTDQKYFRPDFGFPGAGRPSQLDLLVRAVPALLAGEGDQFARALRESLGSITPVAQIPIEIATGRSLYRDAPIASKYSEIPEAQQRLLYGLGRVLPGYQYLGRQANTVTGLGALAGISPETTQDILGVVAPDTERQRIIAGIPEPFTEGMTQDEIAARAEQNALSAVEGFIGLPTRGLTEGQQIAEINRRIKALEELILRERNKRGL